MAFSSRFRSNEAYMLAQKPIDVLAEVLRVVFGSLAMAPMRRPGRNDGRTALQLQTPARA
jgi:hypothetical protein